MIDVAHPKTEFCSLHVQMRSLINTSEVWLAEVAIRSVK